MLRNEIEVGKPYAFREKRKAGEPFHKVVPLEIRSVAKKWQVKVRFLEGDNESIEQWFPMASVVVPWGKHKAIESDERKAEALKQSNEYDDHDSVVEDAVSAVFAATGEDIHVDRGLLFAMSEDAVERLCERAKLKLGAGPRSLSLYAYVDKQYKRFHATFASAERLARAFAAAEPETVTSYISDQVREYKAKSYEHGSYYGEILRQREPGYALARQWAGFEVEANDLRREIERLRHGIKSIADSASEDEWELASKLRRLLHGR